jgi:hypothetical protein
MSSSIDYASAFGIHSVAAAGLFAALFILLGFWFVRQSIKNTTYVYIILTLFCACMLLRSPHSNFLADGFFSASAHNGIHNTSSHGKLYYPGLKSQPVHRRPSDFWRRLLRTIVLGVYPRS